MKIKLGDCKNIVSRMEIKPNAIGYRFKKITIWPIKIWFGYQCYCIKPNRPGERLIYNKLLSTIEIKWAWK